MPVCAIFLIVTPIPPWLTRKRTPSALRCLQDPNRPLLMRAPRTRIPCASFFPRGLPPRRSAGCRRKSSRRLLSSRSSRRRFYNRYPSHWGPSHSQTRRFDRLHRRKTRARRLHRPQIAVRKTKPRGSAFGRAPCPSRWHRRRSHRDQSHRPTSSPVRSPGGCSPSPP